jgi:uncharacterized protein YkwD
MFARAARSAAFVVAALAVAVAVSPARAGPTGRGGSMRALESALLVEIDTFRSHHGRSTLRPSSKLAAAARQHSAEMVTRGYFGHRSADGSSFDRRIDRFYPADRTRYWSVGENLLWSSPGVDAAGALQLWLNSREHRAILLTARWREIGLSAVHATSAPGAFGGREATIVTADFGVRR